MGVTVSYARPMAAASTPTSPSFAGRSAPGLVVLQEWWASTTRSAAPPSAAAAGYRALVPDLLPQPVRRQGGRAPDDGRWTSPTRRRRTSGRGVVPRAQRQRRCGVTLCMGNAFTVLAAVMAPRSATPQSPGTATAARVRRCGQVRAPIMGHWGLRDEFFMPSPVSTRSGQTAGPPACAASSTATTPSTPSPTRRRSARRACCRCSVPERRGSARLAAHVEFLGRELER